MKIVQIFIIGKFIALFNLSIILQLSSFDRSDLWRSGRIIFMECSNAFCQVRFAIVHINNFFNFQNICRPSEDDVYICTSLKIANTSTKYITGFEPVATSTTAHHVLLVGCKNPAREETVFNCGVQGSHTKRDARYQSASDPCESGMGINQLLFTWSKDAPQLILPEDASIPVSGSDTNIDWLVLQVHYAHSDQTSIEGDNTGFIVHYTDVPTPKTVGLLGTFSYGDYPALATTHNEAACKITEDVIIHPFRYFAHTHGLGKVVSGWKVTQDMSWTLVGKHDPQLPNAFYSIDDAGFTMTKGDFLATRCTMVNTGDRLVETGTTHTDEMCQYYIMYWVEGPKTLDMKICKSQGFPFYSWSSGFAGRGVMLQNIPDEEASSL